MLSQSRRRLCEGVLAAFAATTSAVLAAFAATSSAVMVAFAAAIVVMAAWSMTTAQGGTRALAGSQWRPIEIKGETIAETTKLIVRFEADGRVSGNSGCNNFGGRLDVGTADLRIGPLMSTRMACEANVMRLEAAFTQALESSRLYLRDATKLTLKDAKGVTLARLLQKN